MRPARRAWSGGKRAAALRLLALLFLSTAGLLLLRSPDRRLPIGLGTVHASDEAAQGIHLTAVANEDPGLRADPEPPEPPTKGAAGSSGSGARRPSQPAGSPPPPSYDPSAHLLTKELAGAAATGVDGATRLPVIVTWANAHFLDFLENWVAHVNATGCRRSYLVGALDEPTLRWLLDRGVPAFAMAAANATSETLVWGSDAFFNMGIQKIRLIRTFARWGLDVLVTDVDAIFLGCPLDYLARFPDADFLVSSDAMEPSLKGDEPVWMLESADTLMAAPSNIGVILVRASPNATALVERWVELIEQDHAYWDQNAFNDLVWTGLPPEGPVPPDKQLPGGLVLGYDGAVKVGTLPVATICSGHTFFVQRRPQASGRRPYIVHNTYVFSGEVGKRHRFREAQLWRLDGPEYEEGQYVAVANPVAEELKAAVAAAPRSIFINSTVPHFGLMNAQLRTLRGLFGAAASLGRGAVLPQLWCGLDRWWWTHDGHIPGSLMELPFECPADHVLALDAMLADHSPDSHGPALPFRESTFLRKFSAETLRSQAVVVSTCGEGGPPPGATCADGSGPATVDGGQVWLRPGLTGEQLSKALGPGSPASAYKFLFFREAAAAWGGFAAPVAAEQFKRRLDDYASVWCCSQIEESERPGIVWYDFFWDRPHTDRVGREWGAEHPWRPIMEPT